MFGLDVFNRHGHVLLMAHGGDAQQFAPFVGDFIRGAIAVHGAMQHHGRHTGIAVSRCDALHKCLVADGAEAFVVHHHIVILDPVFFLVDGKLVGTTGAALVQNGPVHVGAFTDALADDQLLLGIIMAATAGDEQRL